MLVTLFGIVTEARRLQPENAEASMLITLLGIVTEVIFLFPYKKYEGITSTSFPMVIVFIEVGKGELYDEVVTFFALYLRSTKLLQP